MNFNEIPLKIISMLDATEELLIRHHRELILSNDKVGDACKQSGRCPSSS
jgi:hypothetical protein